jgi:hypothetical protein
MAKIFCLLAVDRRGVQHSAGSICRVELRQTEATDRMAVDGPLHHFIVALFTEMYRLPLTIYFLT